MTTNKQIVIAFNGPPDCGKDYLAEALCKYLRELGLGVYKGTFVDVLHAELQDIYPFWKEVYTRKGKDLPCAKLEGRIPRSVLIQHSNRKRSVYGHDYHRNIFMEDLSRVQERIIVLTDLGYQNEADALYAKYGKDLVVIKVSADGCAYANMNDNRCYVETPADTVMFFNDKQHSVTIDRLIMAVNGYWFDCLDKVE